MDIIMEIVESATDIPNKTFFRSSSDIMINFRG